MTTLNIILREGDELVKHFVLLLIICMTSSILNTSQISKTTRTNRVQRLSDQNLIDAAIEGNLNKIRSALKSGANVNAVDQEGRTALMHSVHNSHQTLLEILGNTGANSNEQNIINLLINAEADVNARDKLGNTALFIASASSLKNTDNISALINFGANINIQNNNGETALMKALKQRRFFESHINNIMALINAGVDLNKQDRQGHTALIIATNSGQICFVNALITAGADLNLPQFRNITPLMFASLAGHIDIVNALIKAGADYNKQAFVGETALMLAAIKGHKNIIIALLNANANPFLVTADAKIMREELLKLHIPEAEIKKNVALAGKTFDAILKKRHPQLFQDHEIQKALTDNKQRFALYKKQVAASLETAIEGTYLLPVLADIITEYAIERPEETATVDVPQCIIS